MIWSVHYGWADSVPPLARLCTAALALGAGGRLGHTTHCWRTVYSRHREGVQEGKPQGISHFKTLHHITSELEILAGVKCTYPSAYLHVQSSNGSIDIF